MSTEHRTAVRLSGWPMRDAAIAASTTRWKQLRSRPQEVEVSASVLSMSMSLDGHIADPNDLLGGDDDHRLHNWFASGGQYVRPSGPAASNAD
jgi:hypothetical protein